MAGNKSPCQELLSPGVSVPVFQLGDIGRLLSESARESIQSFGSKLEPTKEWGNRVRVERDFKFMVP